MLNKKVAVYVPSTVNGNTKAPTELIAANVNKAKKTLAELFGGFTATPAQGGWYSPIHGLIQEEIVIVYAYTNEEGITKAGEVERLAKEIAASMTQEAVTVEIDGAINFIAA